MFIWVINFMKFHFELRIRLVECDEKSEIHFKVETEEFYEEIKLIIDNNGYFTHCSVICLIYISKSENAL